MGLFLGFLSCPIGLYFCFCASTNCLDSCSFVTKTLPTNKSPSPNGFTGEFYQSLHLSCSNSFRKLQRKENLFYEAPISLIPKPDKDATKKKENYRPTSLMNIDSEILNKILTEIQQHIKMVIQHDLVGFILRCKDSSIFTKKSM